MELYTERPGMLGPVGGAAIALDNATTGGITWPVIARWGSMDWTWIAVGKADTGSRVCGR